MTTAVAKATIRKAGIAEYPALLKLRGELDAMLMEKRPQHAMGRTTDWEFDFHLQTGQWIREPAIIIWMAYVGDEPVAYLVGQLVPITGSGENGATCIELYVREEWKKGGTAFALLRHAFQFAKMLKIEALQALVLDVLPDHQARLMRVGFKPIGKVFERRFRHE